MNSSNKMTAASIEHCLSASFEPVDGHVPGKWSLCYSPEGNALKLSVNIDSVVSEVTNVPLETSISEDELSNMLEFLYQVKMKMKENSTD